MSQTISVWMVLAAAVVAANFPFLNDRLLGVWALRSGAKSLLWRFAELSFLYVLVGGLGLFLEQRLGQVYPQGWEFYAITAALFLTFAFPGFVWRYLVRR